MEYCIVVISIRAVSYEVLTCFRHRVTVELQVEGTKVRLHPDIPLLLDPTEQNRLVIQPCGLD